MAVNPTVTPSVSVSTNPGSTICAGTSVTFTAVPTNGGTTPSFQWKVNGVNAGTNSATFTTSTLTNGQIVSCVLTSNANCASPTTATSNSISMTVNATVTPSVSVSINTPSTVCAGNLVMFTATPTNGGSSPTYQWRLNGVISAPPDPIIFLPLTVGAIITCTLISNAICASPTIATVTVNITVNPKPVVNSFSPSSGAVGTTVTIKGLSFATANTVTFGGASTSTFTKQGDTLIFVNVPAGATTNTISVSNAICTGFSSQTFTVIPSNATLNLKTFIQGYYDGSGSMKPVLFNQGVNPSTTVMDTINIELRNPGNVSQIIATRRSEVNTSGISTYSLPGSLIGNSYFIVVKYRNAIETWSKNPVLINANTTFDFSTP
jgi:hypothetical protein